MASTIAQMTYAHGDEEEFHNEQKEFTFHCTMTVAWTGLTVLLFWIQMGFDLEAWFQAVLVRVPHALETMPTGVIATWALQAVGLSISFMAVIGYGSGTLSWFPQFDVKYSAITLCVAAVEELFFRAVLLPPDASGLEAVLAWIIYGLYHLDLIHLHLTFKGGKVARDSYFLLIMDALGLGCVAIYLGTGGSLLASFLLHVTIYHAGLFLFGGLCHTEEWGDACNTCGNIYAPDALFCRKCGTPRPAAEPVYVPMSPVYVPLPVVEPVVETTTCHNCGNSYASDSLFCRKCGTARNGGHFHMD